MRNITMTPVESSQIHSIGHDAETNTLAVRFKSFKSGAPGSLYHYANVGPEVFRLLSEAESTGAYFGKSIKPYTELYPFTKVDESKAVDA